VTEQKSQYVPSDIAESHVTLGNAGAGPEQDREHLYPPDKWGKPAGPPQGAPYEVKAVETWTAKVNTKLERIDAQLNTHQTQFMDAYSNRSLLLREVGLLTQRVASLEDEVAFLKRLIHRHLNGAQEDSGL
jgi:hypothetical protein